MNKFQGIRIPDKNNGVIVVELIDILVEVPNPEAFCWSVLELDAMGDLGEGIFLSEFVEEIARQPNGLIIKWKKLLALAPKFYQIIDTIILGCKKKEELENLGKELDWPYNEIAMRTNSYFFIEMFDSSYWSVFSKDHKFIHRLAEKFKETKFLIPESDFSLKPK